MQEDKNNIDELFRNALKDSQQEPPAYIWDKIDASVHNKSFLNQHYLKLINIAASIVIVSLLTVTAFYFINNNKSSLKKQDLTISKKNLSKNTAKSNIEEPKNIKQVDKAQTQGTEINNHKNLTADVKNINTHSNELKNDKVKSNTKNPAAEKKQIFNVKKDKNIANTNTPVNSKTVNNLISNQPATVISEINADNIQQQSKPQQEAFNTSITDKQNTSTGNTSKLFINNESQPKNNSADDKNLIPEITEINYLNRLSNLLIYSDYNPLNYEELPEAKHIAEKKLNQNHPNIFLGLSFTPEYYVSRSDLLSNKKDLANSTDLAVTFAWKQIFIRTGVGLSLYRTDKFDYQVNYIRNEAVGSYNKVDSVTFGSLNQTPQFHTSEVTVYDDVNHVYKSQLNNKYAYLQIPIIFGYRLNEYKKMSFSINCGPVVSLTLYKKSEEIYNPGNGAIIVNIDNKAISRVNSYYDLLLSFGMNYYINRRFYLNIEPQFRTGISSVYSESNSQQAKKPYSIGLRTGIMYKL